MQKIQSTLILLVICLLLPAQTLLAKSAQSGTRAMPPSYGPGTEIFKNPRYRGNVVDKCLYSRGDRQCGKPAADRFCELNGYRESITYDLHERAGNTFLLGSENRCRGTHCDAFRAVACRDRFNSSIPPSRPPSRPPPGSSGNLYEAPRVNGFPVDRCLYRGRECGKPAADTFCQKQGYSRASNYRLVYTRNSWYLNENRKCSGNCQALASVQCNAGSYQGGNQGQPVLYKNPNYRGTPIDECLRQGRDCGAKAAESYCRAKGHSGLISYSSVSTQKRTWLLKDARYCSGNTCRELRNLRCQDRNSGSGGQPGDFYTVPEYRGYRISRCLTKGKQCDQKAADEFCRLNGYRSASKFQRWRDAGPTIRMGNQQICDKRSCDSLKNIQCSYDPPSSGSDYNREKEFIEPTYQGYPISRCLYKGEGCHQQAADEFCRINGYSNSSNWQLRENIGPTIRLGNKKLCNKRECDGFWNIVCNR